MSSPSISQHPKAERTWGNGIIEAKGSGSELAEGPLWKTYHPLLWTGHQISVFLYVKWDQTQVSCIAGVFFTTWATEEAPFFFFFSLYVVAINFAGAGLSLNAKAKTAPEEAEKTWHLYKRCCRDSPWGVWELIHSLRNTGIGSNQTPSASWLCQLPH